MVSGIGFSADRSYARINSPPSPIRTIDFRFSSYDDSGIIMMGLRQLDTVSAERERERETERERESVCVCPREDGESRPVARSGSSVLLKNTRLVFLNIHAVDSDDFMSKSPSSLSRMQQ